MMIRINELKFELDEPFTDELIRIKISKKTKLKMDQIKSYRIVRESIDARKGIVFSYVVDVETPKSSLLLQNGFLSAPEQFKPIDEVYHDELKNLNLNGHKRPVVIGFGPCGIFAALQLARAGLKPIVLEMGSSVELRQESVELFWKTGKLDERTNVQFGEGGAGAFSDGKLTTRIKDQRIEFVLSSLVEAGAPSDIIYKNKPHIGTDILCNVVKKLREKIELLGGEIHFNTKVIDFEIDETNQSFKAVMCEDGRKIDTNHIVLAIGHSSRDLFYKLYQHGINMEKKPFAMGLRIEHPQVVINAAQYGKSHHHEKLGAAEYKLTYSASNGRSVYSFCMCPGGRVVGSASEEGHLVVNGMSYHSRSLDNANSALLVNVTPDDFESDSTLAGVDFQRKLEALAYQAGGGNYTAPTEKLETFLNKGQFSHPQDYYQSLNVDYELSMSRYAITYSPSYKMTQLKEILPDFMMSALQEAIQHFGKQIPGFDDPRIVLTAVESRSSSPVRIVRNLQTLVSSSHNGLYPCGEGAGYAGGITSSAVDGVKGAEEIIKNILKL